MNSGQRRPIQRGPERRVNTLRVVDQLLTRRTDMLARYWILAGLHDGDPDMTVSESLKLFCQSLMDYVALGHFELYQRIENGEERRQAAIDTAHRTFPKLLESTQVAVSFNDTYDTDDKLQEHINLKQNLSVLGEALAERVQLEDELMVSMMQCRRGTNPLPDRLAKERATARYI